MRRRRQMSAPRPVRSARVPAAMAGLAMGVAAWLMVVGSEAIPLAVWVMVTG